MCRTRSCGRCWSTGRTPRATWPSSCVSRACPSRLPFGALHAPARSSRSIISSGAIRFALDRRTRAQRDLHRRRCRDHHGRRNRLHPAHRVRPQPRAHSRFRPDWIAFACSLIGRREQWDQLAGSLGGTADEADGGGMAPGCRSEIGACQDRLGGLAGEIRYRIAQRAVDHRAVVARDALLQRRRAMRASPRPTAWWAWPPRCLRCRSARARFIVREQDLAGAARRAARR